MKQLTDVQLTVLTGLRCGGGSVLADVNTRTVRSLERAGFIERLGDFYFLTIRGCGVADGALHYAHKLVNF